MGPSLLSFGGFMKKIRMEINEAVLQRYNDFYFSQHPRAKNAPIKRPCHESINVWMIMPRPQMNALKQRWKEFITWFVEDQGYSNLLIEKCEMTFTVYYPTKMRHDVDNCVPKFILDGFVQSGFLVDDDSRHLTKLTLECVTDAAKPKTVITVNVKE